MERAQEIRCGKKYLQTVLLHFLAYEEFQLEITVDL